MQALDDELARHAAENPTNSGKAETEKTVEKSDNEGKETVCMSEPKDEDSIVKGLANLKLVTMDTIKPSKYKKILEDFCVSHKEIGLVPNYVPVRGSGGDVQLDKQG